MRPSGPGGRFTFDPTELRAAITDRTRVLLINSPHNPTGTVLTREELQVVAEVCRDHDLIAISDDVYEHLTFDDAEHIPLASVPGMRSRTVAISSAGKTFSATGWKIGWVCAAPELVRAVNTVKQFLTYTHNPAMQVAVAHALEHESEWVEELRTSLQARRDRLAAGLVAVGLEVTRPQGTYFIQTDVRPLGLSDGEAFARMLPHDAGVVAIPTAVFCDTDDVGRPFVRFAFCKRDEVLSEAITRLTRYAQRPK
jgi:N-succinyldiaminopimelate aminotransferase